MYNPTETCAIFGHRKIVVDERLKKATKNAILELLNSGITIFLFGSKSNFYELCFECLEELDGNFVFKKIAYVCRHEAATLKEDKEQEEKRILKVLGKEVKFLAFDKVIEIKGEYTRNAYIERNKKMIDTASCCLFYYDKNYVVKRSKECSENRVGSGTKISFNYAKLKNKKIINVF